jgi:hypothetical protein
MWQVRRGLRAIKRRLLRTEDADDRQIPNGLAVPKGFYAPPSAVDIQNGYRFILGREPENGRAILSHMHHLTVAEFRMEMLKSAEFKELYTLIRPEPGEHPDVSMGRRTLVFIHLMKTGGTSLRAILEAPFERSRICPVHDNNLHRLSAAELGRFDCFSGHFDFSSVRLIPRSNISVVALFREPRARLVSWYRVLRSHPNTGEFAIDLFRSIAHESSPEEFFEREEVRVIPEAFNYYLMAFGRAPSWFGHNRPVLSDAELSSALRKAKENICALTAIGITERFDESVELICSTLKIPPPATIRALNVTDELAGADPRFRTAGPVEMTPRLSAALDELTRYDNEIYSFALEEFERRRAESGAA